MMCVGDLAEDERERIGGIIYTQPHSNREVWGNYIVHIYI